MSAADKYILLAEDDPNVAELVQHALTMDAPAPHIVHVLDGVEALNYLYARGDFAQREPGNPAVVLLDMKMPRLDGLEVLRQIKKDPALKSTPVVMLTSSLDERDVRQSYLLGANAYVVKPIEFHRLIEALKQIEGFWLKSNLPPPPLNPVHTFNPPV
ncbi:MAG: response regulator [Opitutaceae bacterium]